MVCSSIVTASGRYEHILKKCLSPDVTIFKISLQDIVTKSLVNYRPLCE